MDRGGWQAIVHGVTRIGYDLANNHHDNRICTMVCSRKKPVLAKEIGKVRLFKYLFLYLAVLGLSCIHRLFSCGMQGLVL